MRAREGRTGRGRWVRGGEAGAIPVSGGGGGEIELWQRGK